MRTGEIYSNIIRWVLLLVPVFLLSGTISLKAQEPPPRPIRITATAQTLSFGAFSHGPAGGTVTIEPTGVRSSTGSVVLLTMGYTFNPALFEVRANRGTVISILKGPDVLLSGVPSGSMSLHLGNTIPTSPFVSTVNFNVPISLYVGGTLTVGNSAANPPGAYTGSFYITIVRE